MQAPLVPCMLKRLNRAESSRASSLFKAPAPPRRDTDFLSSGWAMLTDGFCIPEETWAPTASLPVPSACPPAKKADRRVLAVSFHCLLCRLLTVHRVPSLSPCLRWWRAGGGGIHIMSFGGRQEAPEIQLLNALPLIHKVLWKLMSSS